jgi:hypothetical protein
LLLDDIIAVKAELFAGCGRRRTTARAANLVTEIREKLIMINVVCMYASDYGEDLQLLVGCVPRAAPAIGLSIFSRLLSQN